jgi:hypothetical protein
MTNKQYILSEDFSNGCDTDKFVKQIKESDIVAELDYITWQECTDTCDVYFKTELSQNDIALLDSLVAAHDGIPYEYPDRKTILNNVLNNVSSQEQLLKNQEGQYHSDSILF